MAFDNLGAFIQAGQQGGQAAQTPFGYGASNVFDLFQKNIENQMKLGQTAAMFTGQQNWMNQNDPSRIHGQMQINAYNNATNLNQNSGGNSPAVAPHPSGGIPGAPKEQFTDDDYIKKPVLKDIGGIPIQMNENELKPPPDSGAMKDIIGMRTSAQILSRNLSLMTPGVQKFMNPLNPLAQRSGLGASALNIMGSVDPDARDFLNFKAETDKYFMQARRNMEGARSAFPEWKWIEPDYPQANQPPAVYLQKSIQAVKDLKDGEKTLLDTISQSGYRVGPLRQGSLENDPQYQQFLQKYGNNQNVLTQGGEKETDRAEIKNRIASGKYSSSQSQMKKDFEDHYKEPL